jgi:hypothetical protein
MIVLKDEDPALEKTLLREDTRGREIHYREDIMISRSVAMVEYGFF